MDGGDPRRRPQHEAAGSVRRAVGPSRGPQPQRIRARPQARSQARAPGSLSVALQPAASTAPPAGLDLAATSRARLGCAGWRGAPHTGSDAAALIGADAARGSQGRASAPRDGHVALSAHPARGGRRAEDRQAAHPAHRLAPRRRLRRPWQVAAPDGQCLIAAHATGCEDGNTDEEGEDEDHEAADDHGALDLLESGFFSQVEMKASSGSSSARRPMRASETAALAVTAPGRAGRGARGAARAVEGPARRALRGLRPGAEKAAAGAARRRAARAASEQGPGIGALLGRED
eukprot:CAMPEP_0206005820 /NCGR_PEP_ID=MMETSP1464-20131121/4807_1 /ASSEMBLY_ACC=CAM_ASM_001124 /TAXON_ID=119497 /ORGANISM="Exanthemachrysis gayraliae, Strain RCC1523" /LENGTH=289 /DNA_ID=CAMNT_0053379279 /DNA_START=415 /DNA_END=1283 /DNA_ORIENTATION=-